MSQLVAELMVTTPLRFWHDRLGICLAPPDPKATWQANAITALSRSYRHADKFTSVLRLGSGKAASLVTEDGAVLMADIVPEGVRSNSFRLERGDWRTVPNWIADTILNQPDGQFIFAVYGKNPYVQDNLRFSTPDLIEFCGAESMRVRPAVVKRALAAVQGIPSKAWRRAAWLVVEAARQPERAEALDEELTKLAKKHPTLSTALAALPPIGTDDYDAVSMIAAQIDKGDLEWTPSA